MGGTFIACTGFNHNGNLDTAIEMVKAAKIAGANVVKFPILNPDIYVPKDIREHFGKSSVGETTLYEFFKKVSSFGKREFEILDETCKEVGILWTASVYDCGSYDFLMENFKVPFIKIPSVSNQNVKLLKKCRETNNETPVLVSNGMMDSEAFYEHMMNIFSLDDKVGILHCVAAPEQKLEESDLFNIPRLKDQFQRRWEIGYSGHERGYSISAMTLVLGASIIERKFYIGQKTPYIADGDIDILDMGELISLWDAMPKIVGNGEKHVRKSEEAQMHFRCIEI